MQVADLLASGGDGRDLCLLAVTMNETPPGQPGIPPRWTSSAKSGVGTALHVSSRIWFTLSHGIVNEVYYPRIDQACIRDLGLIVTDGQAFFSEEKRDAQHEAAYLQEGVPAFRLTNRCHQGRYRIEKEVLSDPERDAFLQRIRFVPLQGKLADYHLYALLAPHLGNRGSNNTAWIGAYKGETMLFAQRDGLTLALACSAPWVKASAGYVGLSDGWQDLTRHKELRWIYDRAEKGNVALTGEIDLTAGDSFVLALGFGLDPAEAGQRARASLQADFDRVVADYVSGWQAWQKTVHVPQPPSSLKRDLCHISTAVLRTHESKRFPGGLIASLSIPWGFAKGDDDLGGYHIVWPRDLVETAGGLLAVGALEDARRVLFYLESVQEQDGHWAQNMWLDGTPYWGGIQMDETALPILLLDLARRCGTLAAADVTRLWPMARRAAGYVVRNGPVTQQDRWEEDPGYSPFTLAAEIAALLAAADLAEEHDEADLAAYLRETADAWNDMVEAWTYVTGTALAQDAGVDGYYVRIAPPDAGEAASPVAGYVPIKNRPPGQSDAPATLIISPDALALVRFGLRAADDPRIVNTVKVIDKLLKTQTPAGPLWHRYNDDGYGEHEDGSPFDGTGVGRGWPLLVGERAHYALARGDRQEAIALLNTMTAYANDSGLLPEQVWEAEDIPDRELFCGRPSGSAMPLVWAHAEYLKLRRSLADNSVFDLPPQPVQRYQVQQTTSPYTIWRFNQKGHSLDAGNQLRLELLAPATVRWSSDRWQQSKETEAKARGLGVYVADLPTSELAPGAHVSFTFYWPKEDRWEGVDYTLDVVAGT